MNPVIYLMIFVWVAVELVQRARKRPSRSAMKAGAIWGTCLAAVTTLGQAGPDVNVALVFGAALATWGAIAVLVYWIRVGLGKVFRRTTPTKT